MKFLYPYGILLVVCWCSKHISQVLFLIQLQYHSNKILQSIILSKQTAKHSKLLLAFKLDEGAVDSL